MQIKLDAISNGQLYNHFPDTQPLTTKIGLTQSMRRNYNSERFFPRCYDFTDESQIIEFENDFNKTAVINLLKRYNIEYSKIHKRIFDQIAQCKTGILKKRLKKI